MTKEQGAVTLADLGASEQPHAAQAKRSRLAYLTLEQAFPKIDPGHRVFGSRILVQIRTPAKKTAGGLVLVAETQEIEAGNSQVAKVLQIGPLAFKDRDTMKPWPEGAWVREGMFVRVPKFGGDRFEVPIPDSKENEKAVFVIFADDAMIAEVTGDPLQVISYI